MKRSLQLKWARKIMQAKYFVVLTDKESVIAVDGADPDSMTDQLALRSQAAAVKDFYAKLGELVKAHDKKLNKVLGGGSAITASGKAPKAKKASKRKV